MTYSLKISADVKCHVLAQAVSFAAVRPFRVNEPIPDLIHTNVGVARHPQKESEISCSQRPESRGSTNLAKTATPGLPTLEEALLLEPNFKTAAHEDKVIRNTAL
jgi:hypothetical protein